MFRRLVYSAIGAGIAVCLVASILQVFTTEPLILHAEVFEKAGEGASPVHQHPAPAVTADPAAEIETPINGEDRGPWEPAEGFERTAYSVLANLVVGIAVSLILLGAMGLKGDPIDPQRGLLWGLAGFVAASLLPALGLPPELPGTPSAEIVDRQAWWVATALASAVGIFLTVYGAAWIWRAAGLALLVVPHVVGAPAPSGLEAAYPAGMAGEFVVASLVVSAVVWATAGVVSGWLHRRLSRAG